MLAYNSIVRATTGWHQKVRVLPGAPAVYRPAHTTKRGTCDICSTRSRRLQKMSHAVTAAYFAHGRDKVIYGNNAMNFLEAGTVFYDAICFIEKGYPSA